MRRILQNGFTLIELMIVVAVIGILAAVAIPKFADLIGKAESAETKGSLGAIRSALVIYYTDTEGLYPVDTPETNPSTILATTLLPKYIEKIPQAMLKPHHSSSNLVITHNTPQTHPHDEGYWGYGSVQADSGWGEVWVMCTHTDGKGNNWSTY